MPGSPAVSYRVIFASPHAHLFTVELRLAAPVAAETHIYFPAWIPGSYLIREFAKHVVTLAAADSEGPLQVEKLDKASYRIAPARGPLLVRYEIYAADLSVRGAYFDAEFAFFNGSSLFAAVAGAEAQAAQVDVLAPAHAPNWRVATAMPALDVDAQGFGAYLVQDYEELIDHPFLCGDLRVVPFNAAEVPHRCAIVGRHEVDAARLARDLQRLCEQHIDFFGRPAPMPRYDFLVIAVGDGYGGLEHRGSTALITRRDHLPGAGATVDNGYREFLGLCSHEYFHLWNVKRIRPAAFTPYRLDTENYSRLLWAFEGFTSYYDDLALVRAGLISIDDYLKGLGETITRVLRAPGHAKQSVAEASFDAWIKFYRQDENAPNALANYYTKGALIGLVLDLTIRQGSDDRHTLDDVMRYLWATYGRSGIGVPEDGIEQAIQTVTGLDLRVLLADAVYGTAPLPLAERLREAGVVLKVRGAKDDKDRGGAPQEALPEVSLGARLADTELKLLHVLNDGPAERAGLAAGDVVVAFDGLRASRALLERLLKTRAPGDTLELHAFRRDELRRFQLTLQAPAQDTAYLVLDEAADAAQLARRSAWLGQPL